MPVYARLILDSRKRMQPLYYQRAVRFPLTPIVESNTPFYTPQLLVYHFVEQDEGMSLPAVFCFQFTVHTFFRIYLTMRSVILGSKL